MNISKLNECIKTKNLNQSQAREAIYRVLQDTDDCLTVEQIVDNAKNIYPKKVSVNTVYRHLNFFVKCNLAAVIQDDFKKAYYCVIEDNEPMGFLLCSKCNCVSKVPLNHKNKQAYASLLDSNDTGAYITLHCKCISCR